MIWDFEKSLMRRLLLWACLSILVGVGLIAFGDPFWRGFGIQAFAWGAADAIIVWFGWHRLKNRPVRAEADQSDTNETSRMRKILWINTALDVLYVASGAALIMNLGSESAFWRGTGWGIILQGAFLFFFDMGHALHIPNISPPSSLTR